MESHLARRSVRGVHRVQAQYVPFPEHLVEVRVIGRSRGVTPNDLGMVVADFEKLPSLTNSRGRYQVPELGVEVEFRPVPAYRHGARIALAGQAVHARLFAKYRLGQDEIVNHFAEVRKRVGSDSLPARYMLGDGVYAHVQPVANRHF